MTRCSVTIYTPVPPRAMNLASALAQSARPRLPKAVLFGCLETNRVVMDNIVFVALEFVPALNIPLTTMRKQGDTYHVNIPVTMDRFAVSLEDLRVIQLHAPARIASVALARDGDDFVFRVSVCSENNLVRFTELDIVRLNKRAR